MKDPDHHVAAPPIGSGDARWRRNSVYAAIIKEWGVISFGVALVLAGFLITRMKGPFSLSAPNLQFKGELVDPNDEDEPRRQLDERTAR
jgi:hypothetical protein